jgi:phage shock protein E
MDHQDADFLQRAAAARARVAQTDPRDVDALMRKGAVALDVREAEEHARGSVPGAVNVSINDLAIRIAAIAPDKSAPIVCFCNAGNRGSLAAAHLQDMGYVNVSSIAGGLKAYVASRRDEDQCQ